jgi:hypothetical protein
MASVLQRGSTRPAPLPGVVPALFAVVLSVCFGPAAGFVIVVFLTCF